MSNEVKLNNEGKQKNKKVVILGTAPSCKDAPFQDKSFDIWGVAHCLFLAEVSRIDRIFELHSKPIYQRDGSLYRVMTNPQTGQVQYDVVNSPYNARFPNAELYLQDVDPIVPKSKKFPLAEMLEKYKINKGTEWEADYFSSSLAYMVCMAIDEGYQEIHVYGIHLLMDEEYFFQRPCFEYYLGLAAGKGIKVVVAPAADILKFDYLYGFQDMTETTRKIRDRIQEFDKRMQGLQQQKAQASNAVMQMDFQINQLIGAKEDALYMLRCKGVEGRKSNPIF